jgi:hypothetical protein
MEIDEILEKLMGNIKPVCETNEDNIRFNRLETYKIALNYIVEELIECVKWKDDYRYSADRIGKEAFDILSSIFEDIEYYVREEK